MCPTEKFVNPGGEQLPVVINADPGSNVEVVINVNTYHQFPDWLDQNLMQSLIDAVNKLVHL